MKVYLVVLESDKASVAIPCFNQFKAQKLCHFLKRKTGLSHSVITESMETLSTRLFFELLNRFPSFASDYNKLCSNK